MITREMLDIYERYGGDPDRFQRGSSHAERTVLPWDLWDEIDQLVQDLLLMVRGLAAPSMVERTQAAIDQAAADENVAERLRDIARKESARYGRPR